MLQVLPSIYKIWDKNKNKNKESSFKILKPYKINNFKTRITNNFLKNRLYGIKLVNNELARSN